MTGCESTPPQTTPPTVTPSPGDACLRIATRKSPLAMWQAEFVAEALGRHGTATRLVPLVSSGDVDMRPIDQARQVGVFTKRIQLALLDGEADVAVHSLKDLPTEPTPGLVVTAIPTREIVNDALVSAAAHTLDSLPPGARVGTGSRRRKAQLLARRPDLRVEGIRGNVQRRLARVNGLTPAPPQADKQQNDDKQQQAVGDLDAIILAEAGIRRLGMDDLPRRVLSIEEMLPAPGQGALAIETLGTVAPGDPAVSVSEAVSAAVAVLDQLDCRLAVTAERTLLGRLNGGCLAPIAAHATIRGGELTLRARVLSMDGAECLERTESTELPPEAASAIAASIALAGKVADQLADAGARELVAAAHEF